MDHVSEIQFAGRIAALELNAALVVGVVEQQLVVAAAAEFPDVNAPLGRGVAVAAAMPYRAVVAGQVALGRGRVAARRGEHLGIAVAFALVPRRRAARRSGRCTAHRRQPPVDVVLDKLHQHFLISTRQYLAAHRN